MVKNELVMLIKALELPQHCTEVLELIIAAVTQRKCTDFVGHFHSLLMSYSQHTIIWQDSTLSICGCVAATNTAGSNANSERDPSSKAAVV